MSLQILRTIADPMFQSVCYILHCDETGEGIISDPGPVDGFKDVLERDNISLKAIVNTHGHMDHVFGAAATRAHFKIPFMIHEDEKALLGKVNQDTSSLGLPPIEDVTVDKWLCDGDTVSFGNLSIEIIHTPGHTPGGVCLYHPGHLICGDTIFAGNIGRTDLFGGDHSALIDSIRNRILTLPPETILYPGHGPSTTVGQEAAGNPWLR